MTLIQLGDMKIDPETGEIADWQNSAANVEEELDIILSRMRQAQEQVKLWEQNLAYLKMVATGHFASLNVPKFEGTNGQCYMVPTESVERGEGESIAEMAARLQVAWGLGNSVMDTVLLGSIEKLNAKRFREMAVSVGVPEDKVPIKVTRSLTVRGVRKPAPPIKEVNDD